MFDAEPYLRNLCPSKDWDINIYLSENWVPQYLETQVYTK